MTKDLEDTLNELGPEYRSVVDRLLSMPSAPTTNRESPAANHRSRIAKPYLLAASLFLVFGLAIWSFTSTTLHSSLFPLHSSLFPLRSSLLPLHSSPSSAPAVYTVAYATDEYALRAILDSQRSDGSWSNDYLTMQNAAALRRAHDEASQIAYKRAVRYLRTKGLGPISDAELQERSDKMKLPKSGWFLI